MTLLLFVITYLLIATGIMLCNMRDFRFLLSSWEHMPGEELPLVSVCIPARNEEDTIAECLRSVLRQNYPRLEVLVLDDRSDDRTPAILRELEEAFPGRLTTLEGRPLPDGWLGKPWACRQLAGASSGEILLFVDADTRLEPETVSRTVRTMARELLDFLTVWPQQRMDHFWARRVIPLVYHALLSTLPARFVRRTPGWLPPPLRRMWRKGFAAACGQYMAFRRQPYESVGGHGAVRDRIVEDVALARRIRQEGFTMQMFNGADALTTNMYAGAGEMWEGFRKNFLAGFGGSLPLFVLMAVFSATVFLLPWAGLAWGLLYGTPAVTLLSAAAAGLAVLQRLMLARMYGWSGLNALSHPLGVLWFEALALRVAADRITGTAPRWKGRPLR